MTDDFLPIGRRRAALLMVAAVLPCSPALHAAWPPVWRSRFDDRGADWGRPLSGWGLDNHQVLASTAEDGTGGPGHFVRIHLREGSIDPASMLRRGLPRSGSGFKLAVLAGGAEAATLRYRVRFAPGFDFVLGGKLPGLFGGRGHSGGVMPAGDDGFSLRLMWRERGQGEVYAYLPVPQRPVEAAASRHGRSLLRGHFAFVPGRWHQVVQQVVLNTPGQADGLLRMAFDGQPVGEAAGLLMRTVPGVRLDGLFFDVFFGGNDDRWAARADTHIDFAQFELHAHAGRAESLPPP